MDSFYLYFALQINIIYIRYFFFLYHDCYGFHFLMSFSFHAQVTFCRSHGSLLRLLGSRKEKIDMEIQKKEACSVEGLTRRG
jgi:hypothetical protein